MNRGGSWNNTAENCTAAYRNTNSPDNSNNNLGFRLLAAPLNVGCINGTDRFPVLGPCRGEIESEAAGWWYRVGNPPGGFLAYRRLRPSKA